MAIDISEIELTAGLVSSGSEASCKDGQLQVCHGMVAGGGGLSGVGEAETVVSPSGYDLVFVHETSEGAKWILSKGQELFWCEEGDDEVGILNDLHITTDVMLDGMKTEGNALIDFTEGDYKISAVGNVLVVSLLKAVKNVREATATGGVIWSKVEDPELVGVHYFRWMSEAGNDPTYKCIGMYPPDCGLVFELRRDSSIQKDVAFDATGTGKTDFEEVVQTETVKNAFFGLLNETVAECKEGNYFLRPFFVRYAYEMYDGTYTRQSAPVLMVPDYGSNPSMSISEHISNVKGSMGLPRRGRLLVLFNTYGTSDPQKIFPYITFEPIGSVRCVAHPMLLYAQMKMSVSEAQRFKTNWDGIVTGIKIFITPEILDYSLDGDLRIGAVTTLSDVAQEYWAHNYAFRGGTWRGSTGTPPVTVCRHHGAVSEKGGTLGKGHSDSRDEADATHLYQKEEDLVRWEIAPPAREGLLADWMTESYVFYHIKTYRLDELQHINEDGNSRISSALSLENLTTFEQLPDGFQTNAKHIAGVLHTYNSRLNMADVKVCERSGFPPGWLSSFSQPYTYNAETSSVEGYAQSLKATVFIEDNGLLTGVESAECVASNLQWGSAKDFPGWFFYPNPNAKYIRIVETVDGSESSLWLKLRPHPYLYGAYYWNGFYGQEFDTNGMYLLTEKKLAALVGKPIPQPNYVYTSEAENPFVFPSEGVNVVGGGRVIALKNAGKAMSEGTAYGQSPLYVFATDGVWPLAVGDTGLYTALNPPTRETLINNRAEAVLQADNCVLFLSDRGLMQLSGQGTKLLSGAVSRRFQTLDAVDLPKWETLTKKFFGVEEGGSVPPYVEADDFMEYITHEDVRMAFDYAHYRVYIYRSYDAEDTGTHVAFVYDMVSEAWGSVCNRMTSSVEAFPETLVNMIADTTDVLDQPTTLTVVGKFLSGVETIGDGGRCLYLTRPLKLGKADILKTVRAVAQRGSFVAGEGGKRRWLALWGSDDCATWRMLTAVDAVKGRDMIRGIGGRPYKYFIIGCWLDMDIRDSVARLTVGSEARRTNRIR